MIKLVYIDTSVVGGVFDKEFELWTNLFFKSVEEKTYKIATSALLDAELEDAPEYVRNFLDGIPDEHRTEANYNEDAIALADIYQAEGIVGPTSLTDCRHIATATVNGINILASWNFKHIVNLNKIRLYNAVNLKSGYNVLEIRTPRELLEYEN